MAKQPEKTQREKFEEMAREVGLDDVTVDQIDKVIGKLGSEGPKTEAEARREEGKQPR